jgi:hypothetical protein
MVAGNALDELPALVGVDEDLELPHAAASTETKPSAVTILMVRNLMRGPPFDGDLVEAVMAMQVSLSRLELSQIEKASDATNRTSDFASVTKPELDVKYNQT